MQVTEHFTLSEAKQPARHGFPEVPYPMEWVDDRLLILYEQLEGIREVWGVPITLISVYRSPEYNKAVGGKTLSQHLKGNAADFVVKGVAPGKVADKVDYLFRTGQIRIGGLGRYPNFTHIDIRSGPLTLWTGTRTKT